MFSFHIQSGKILNLEAHALPPRGYAFLPSIVQDRLKLDTETIYALNLYNASVSIRYCADFFDLETRISCTPVQKYIVIGQHPDDVEQ